MNKKLLGIGLLLVLLAVGAGYLFLGAKSPVNEQAEVASVPVGDITEAATEVKQAEAKTETSEARITDTKFAIDVQKALTARSLGNPEAPVKLEEFASLTCPHCAHFHKENFDRLKAEYIDTGKVYFTFTDFPLNAPALDASMIARCLPEEHYFPFLKLLFETQDKWMFEQDVRSALKQNAKLVGAGDELLNSCLENQDIKQGIVAQMQEKSDKHQIKSTPSLLFNGAKVVAGANNFDELKGQIEGFLNGASVAVPETSPAPVTAPEPSAGTTETSEQPETKVE